MKINMKKKISKTESSGYVDFYSVITSVVLKMFMLLYLLSLYFL